MWYPMGTRASTITGLVEAKEESEGAEEGPSSVTLPSTVQRRPVDGSEVPRMAISVPTKENEREAPLLEVDVYSKPNVPFVTQADASS